MPLGKLGISGLLNHYFEKQQELDNLLHVTCLVKTWHIPQKLISSYKRFSDQGKFHNYGLNGSTVHCKKN